MAREVEPQFLKSGDDRGARTPEGVIEAFSIVDSARGRANAGEKACFATQLTSDLAESRAPPPYFHATLFARRHPA